MASEKAKELHIGEAILKPGVHPVKVYVGKNGEYWLCGRVLRPSPQVRALPLRGDGPLGGASRRRDPCD
jgi:hypothetical protein